MGLVIDKTVRILKLVAVQEHCKLNTLCAVTGYKKSALCQQLASMTSNGLLLRDAAGEYHIGPLFSDLLALRERKMQLMKMAESIATDLNSACGESITVATIRNSRYRRLFSCSSYKITRLTASAPDEERFYGNATGRILLSYASTETRLRILQRLGLPTADDWPDGPANMGELEAALEVIRRQGYAEVELANRTQVFLASGMLYGLSGLPVAIGINVPYAQYVREKYLKLLVEAIERIKFVDSHRL